MQTYTVAERIPQSIADTVTVIDDRERRRIQVEASRTQAWLDQRLARASREIFSEDVTVTPPLARLILQRNPSNRKVTKQRPFEIKADLLNNRWVFNGETVIVSKDGPLNDGQHRLYACVEANKPFRTMMVFGVDRNARNTTDQGGMRTVADRLSMSGHDEAIIVAAVARMIFLFDKYGRLSTGGVGGASRGGAKVVTKADIESVAVDNQGEIVRSIGRVTSRSSALLGSKSFVVFCHFILSKVDQTAADTFIERAIDGTNLNKGEPIYTLRERFMSDPKMRLPERFEAVVRAWNAYRGKSQLAKIQIMGRVPKVAGLKAEG